MHKIKQDNKKYCYVLLLFLLILPLFVFKYYNFIPLIINKIFNKTVINFLDIISPLGISYYTLTLIGYLTDIFWDSYEPEKNFIDFVSFSIFFPIQISGPIIRYKDFYEQKINKVKFSWDNLYFGFYRIVYGLMKKLVIADNLYNTIVNPVFEDCVNYSPRSIIIATIAYAFYIYCDFSGCMDIIYGVSNLFGIKLKENFKAPFFSKNISEFWRRWHISLGEWGKDYIMYPILKSELFIKLNKKCKKMFGKKIGKKIPPLISMLILWIIIGIWHGASFVYVFAAGIMPWLYSFASNVLEEHMPKFKNGNNIFIKCFRIIRTIFLMCIIWFAVCCKEISNIPIIIKHILCGHAFEKYIMFEGNGMYFVPISLVIVFVFDMLIYKEIDIKKEVFKLPIFVRYLISIMIITLILMGGVYGPNYSPAGFIYGGF